MDFLFVWFAFWFDYIWQVLFGKYIELLPLELENGEGKVEKTVYTDEQQKRKVKCRTKEGKYFEVPWCLMMQSKLFSDMWTNLGQEKEILTSSDKQGMNTAGNEDEKSKNDEKNSNSEFVFYLPTISKKCFRHIVDWMRHRHGKPEFELKFGQETGQQIWFQPDEWECKFGFGGGKNKMNLEVVKELYLAANFLDLNSLFHYCVQEFAFAVIQANKLEQVREILCLADDLTPEEKAAIYQEFDIPVPKEKKRNYWEEETINVGRIKNPLPPELVHPIFAKLSLSDQRWLLPLNRDAYNYLADRVRKNWPKWMNMLKLFFIEENPNWYYGYPGKYIPSLQHDQPAFQWTASHFLANPSLQTEMLITQNYIEHQINSINAGPIDEQIDELARENNKKKFINSTLFRAIDHMEALIGAERQLQPKLKEISKRYENIMSMNCYKQGLIHLVEQRRQILEELEANEMKELRKKLADSEKCIHEYWVKRL